MKNKIFSLILAFLSLFSEVLGIQTRLEYGGITFDCSYGCGSPRYDADAKEILRIFNKCSHAVRDLEDIQMLRTDVWYNELIRFDPEDRFRIGTISRKQADFLESFNLLKTNLNANQVEYYKYLNSKLNIHIENLMILQEIAAKDIYPVVQFESETDRYLGPGSLISDVEGKYSRITSLALTEQENSREWVLKQLNGENDFVRGQIWLENMYQEIDSRLQKIFLSCLENHQEEGIAFRESIESFLQQDYFGAMNVLRRLIEILESQDFSPHALGKIHLIQGQLQSEYGLYADSIASLTKAIAKSPDLKEAYLERAGAYFEMGDFDKALDDYLHFGTKNIPSSSRLDWLSSAEISAGIAAGIIKGTKEGLVEFIPETLSSIKGLCHGLWAFCSRPVGASKDFVNAAVRCVEYLKNHSPQEILQTLVPELRELIQRYDDLADFDKGELIGHVIGKYGTDIFLSYGSMTLAKSYRDLKRANQLLTLEALASELEKKSILKQVIEYDVKHAELVKKLRDDTDFVKTLKTQNLSETTIRKILHELGYETFPRPKQIPLNYISNFSDSGCGMKYIDPLNPHNYVRVKPGNPLSSNPCQQKPYVMQMRNGKAVDKFGKIVD